MSKRRNYNQDFYKVGGSPQPGDETVLRRQKRRLSEAEAKETPGRDDLAAKMGRTRDTHSGTGHNHTETKH